MSLIQEQQRMIDKMATKILRAQSILEKYDNCDDVLDIEDFGDFTTVVAHNSTQKKSPLYEKYVVRHANATPMTNRDGLGDLERFGAHYEFKVSFHEQLNLRQLRLWEDVHYVIIHVDEDTPEKTVYFLLSQDEMKEEVQRTGNQNTHGNKNVNAINDRIEKSVTLTRDTEHYDRWLRRYQVTESFIFSDQPWKFDHRSLLCA